MISEASEDKLREGARIATTLLVVVLVAITTLNSFLIHDVTSMMRDEGGHTTMRASTEVSLQGGVIPTGVPDDYGAIIGVSYDDVSPNDPRRADAAIAKLAVIDRQTELQGDDLTRYSNILYHMHGGTSCEYCCGARSIIFEDGRSACGCAHSFAMRGLTKYLILEHGNEYSDQDILEEVNKWKVLFFPGQTTAKAEALDKEGIEITYANLGSNQYRGIEQGRASGTMVGGC